MGSALAWLPAITLSQLMSAYFLHAIPDHPFQGLQKPFMAILAGTSLCLMVAIGVSNFVSGVPRLIIAIALGAVSAATMVWAADRRDRLGFAKNLALVFPQFATFFGLSRIENE